MSDATLLAAANTDDAGHGSADRQVDKTNDRRVEETIDRRVEDTIDRQVEETTDRRRRLQRLLSDYPVLVMVAIGWIFAILAVALFADLLAPYGYSKLDLSARLAPPVFMGGSPGSTRRWRWRCRRRLSLEAVMVTLQHRRHGGRVFREEPEVEFSVAALHHGQQGSGRVDSAGRAVDGAAVTAHLARMAGRALVFAQQLFATGNVGVGVLVQRGLSRQRSPGQQQQGQ